MYLRLIYISNNFSLKIMMLKTMYPRSDNLNSNKI